VLIVQNGVACQAPHGVTIEEQMWIRKEDLGLPKSLGNPNPDGNGYQCHNMTLRSHKDSHQYQARGADVA